MMELLKFILEVLVRLPLLALFSIPLYLVMWGLYAYISKREIDKLLAVAILSGISTILLTPMPIGMLVIFIPNGFFVLGNAAYNQKIWDWFAVSGSVTLLVSVVLFYWLLSHNKAVKLTATK